ncbi:MAG: aldehyde dehydrogenase family protein, partial [Planctomycetota bacterium]
ADYELEITPTRRGAARFRPHGVMAVVGPFNFPMHLPNGHIVPALLMGNTVVFKPSDKAPACGHRLAELYREAIAGVGGPPGVVNLVHGAGDVAAALVTHAALDGILFTGSWPVGRRIVEANLDHPGRIIALEMGGNNAAYVHEDADLEHAALECLRGSFISAGQRCTCTRRIVVHERVIDAFVKKMATLTSTVLIGDPRGEAGQDVFMGPVITEDAATAVVNAQSAWVRGGATPVIESKVLDHPSGGHFVSPGITRVDRFTPEEGEAPGCDIEIFGPLVRIASVSSLDEAIGQVGATRFGLAAAVFTADVGSGGAAARFLNEVRAGCVNVNNATAGASGTLPFGGFGLSGNHRPAGAFSLDYCAAPVASLIETDTSQRPVPPGVRYGK